MTNGAHGVQPLKSVGKLKFGLPCIEIGPKDGSSPCSFRSSSFHCAWIRARKSPVRHRIYILLGQPVWICLGFHVVFRSKRTRHIQRTIFCDALRMLLLHLLPGTSQIALMSLFTIIHQFLIDWPWKGCVAKIRDYDCKGRQRADVESEMPVCFGAMICTEAKSDYTQKNRTN